MNIKGLRRTDRASHLLICFLSTKLSLTVFYCFEVIEKFRKLCKISSLTMNQKVLVAFLLVAVSAVLAHPGIAREDALVPAVIAADAVRAPEEPAAPAAPAVPEEQPTSPAALLDDATAEAVTLPAEQEGSLPAAEIPNNDNIVVPNVALPVV